MPMRLLADIVYLVVYYIVGYRREVVRRNLANAFPEKDEAERKGIERRYYRYLADIAVEFVHNMYASPAAIKRRYRFTNRQLVDRYYERGQSIVLLSAHYGNWEYMVSSLNMQLLHHGIGVGKPLNDKVTGPYIAKKRIRYGTEVVDQRDVRQVVDFYDRHHVPCALMMLGDQSPSNPEKSYWTTFLNQDTAFLYGAEYFARKYNYPVVYYTVNRVRRGYYEVTFSHFSEHPQEEPQYAIVERYARTLEEQIRQRPELWLWSHRRWKLSRKHASVPSQGEGDRNGATAAGN